MAFLAIKRGDVETHRRWMTRSYALMFAAVTLRLELPLLASNFGFDDGYRVVSWLCWVPNVLVAEAILRSWNRDESPGALEAGTARGY